MKWRSLQTLSRVGGLLGFCLLWQLASFSLGEYWVPGPVAVGHRVVQEAANGKLIVDTLATLKLLAMGTVLGMLAGVSLACVLRLFPRTDALLQPFITALMSIPKLGLVPLLVLWFGTGLAPKVMLVALTVLFIVFSFIYSGLSTIDPRLVMSARIFGANSFQVTTQVVIPTVLPFHFTGLQVALPWAVSAALVAEYLSSNVGIGSSLEQARQMSDSIGVYYGITLATALVLVANALLVLMRSWAIRGRVQ